MGMSERVPGTVPLETRMDDIGAVMDAAGSDRAAVMGESEGGPLAILFAAARPERTRALVLQGAEVRELKDEDWPWGELTSEAFEAVMATPHPSFPRTCLLDLLRYWLVRFLPGCRQGRLPLSS